MHQTFTGSSRRRPQVNLSGRKPANPFASGGSSAGSYAAGPQAAIASAQKDRLARQQQRAEQKAWAKWIRASGGLRSRRRTFAVWREIWDKIENGVRIPEGEPGAKIQQDEQPSGGEQERLGQLRRLMLFYEPREKDDVDRLLDFGTRQAKVCETVPCEGGPWPANYLKLERACLSALRWRPHAKEDRDGKVDLDRKKEADHQLLMVLAFAACRTPMQRKDALEYYEVLTGLKDVPQDRLHTALIAPLRTSMEAYVGLAILLARPLDQNVLMQLTDSSDAGYLTEALMTVSEQQFGNSARARLWLLGNTIFLAGDNKNDAFTTVIARLMGSLADDVDFEGMEIDLDNVSFDRDVLSKVSTGLPLNVFLKQQILSLVQENSVRNLLPHEAKASAESTKNTQLLAGYALTLLRCFPRKADEIRMWLHRGPMSSMSAIPAAQYFWNAAKSSSVFGTIWENSRNAAPLVKTQEPTTDMRDGWTVILMFLELYTFLLKVMDDEEFVGSGTKLSAIPLDEVGALVTFLKNLGFTLYFNASEFRTGEDTSRESSTFNLSRHFKTASTNGFESSKPEKEVKPLMVAGLPGLTIDYLKGLVTGLLRAIYDRDSRRHFLPKGHWLMTSRFDMTSFIPGVVAEEEARHTVQEQDDEDKEVESDEEIVPARGQNPRQRGYASALRAQQARERAQRKASRKRYLESVAPRLEILQNMPFFIPFTTRVEIFRQFVQLDQVKRRDGATDPDLWRQNMMFNPSNGGPSPRDILARRHARIRRKNEFHDAFEHFYDLGNGLKEPIQITFVDEFDIPEAGIDGGGVTKEFLTSVISQAFDPENEHVEKFFVENEKHLLHPNPTAIEDLKLKWTDMGYPEDHAAIKQEIRGLLQQYEFLGRIIGKCLYEGILVDVSFAGFFLKKWALTGGNNSSTRESGYQASINDLRELDEGLYKGLHSLKNTPSTDIESLGLTFTVDDEVGPPHHRQVIERELVPDGANKPLNATNLPIYIRAMSQYRLQGQSYHQTAAFLKGLGAIVQPSWLSMFNQTELQTLIGGAQASIDVADLRRNTLYGGTYVIGDDGAEHPSIRMFWDVMAGMADADRRAVLKFVTSTPRGPLLGFGSLNPRFSIRDSGSDEQRLPTASTCVNLLKLPMYRSERVLREKLLQVVRLGAGFDLS